MSDAFPHPQPPGEPTGEPATKLCPFCAETIKAAAVVCRFCGRDLQPPAAGLPAAGRLPPAPVAVVRPGEREFNLQGPLPPPPAKKGRWRPLLGLGLLLLAAFVCTQGGVFGSAGAPRTPARPAPTATPAMTAAQLQASARTVAYDDLARNTEQYEGDLIWVAGDVLQVLEADGEAQLRVNMDGDFGQTVFVRYPGYGAARVLEGDTVRMVALVDGRITYTAVLGNEISLPALTAQWLQVQTGE